MKITHGETIITDVLGIRKIIIRSDGGGGQPVIIVDAGPSLDGSWEVGPLTVFRDALTAAIDIANGAGAPAAPKPREPRVFVEGDEMPAGLLKVTDCDGDVWERTKATSTWYMPSDDAGGLGWERLLKYAPLTEVLDDRAPSGVLL